MAKIGTAQIEIKSVLNEEELDKVCSEIERRISEAVQRGLTRPWSHATNSPDTNPT